MDDSKLTIRESYKQKGLWFGGIAGAIIGIIGVSLFGDPLGPDGAMGAGTITGLGAVLGRGVGRWVGWWKERKSSR